MSKKQETQQVKTIRCAIYTRKSTEEGLQQEFNSLDAQREAGEAFIASQKAEGWRCLPEMYDDGGFSGGNLERPAMKRLMEDIEAGKVDCVVVYKVDRLSRSLMDFSRVMETFDKFGVSFVSVTQQFNTTHSMGRLTLNILLSFAQFEREIIGERIRDKIAAMRAKGKWSGGMPVLGFDVDRSGTSPKLVVNATEAKQVRKIFEMYLEYRSLLPVVKRLQEFGWPNKIWRTRTGRTRGGRVFDKPAVHSLLTSPLYVGKIAYKEHIYEGEHDAIIDQDTFDAVGKMLKAHQKGRAQRLVNKYSALLKGILVCPYCDCRMVHRTTKRKSSVYRYYACQTTVKSGADACEMGSVSAAMIEAAVVDELRVIVDDQGLRDAVYQGSKGLLDKEQAEVETLLAQLKAQINRDTKEVQRILKHEVFENLNDIRVEDLKARIATAEADVVVATEKLKQVAARQLSRLDIDIAMSDFKVVWTSLTAKERVHLVELLIARVVYDPDAGSMAISYHPTAITALVEECEEAVA
ncbi:recombinase family protein [Rubripirellula reticaptiva]|uniref:DNA-invertase hin n=1 Tax=Rubripirellula reticaptiva TaxID=2528013 RepID=A0A5C6EFT3_9BACT|nr:recombinase family protein [Rubripirellula reticaptiva]TWU46426.1 DNA-invertase hin [Rubripirellula reticaptiva]